jgi:hypothetical protein
VNHLDPRPRQRDSLADANLTKKRRYGTGRERATTVIERYLLLASDKMGHEFFGQTELELWEKHKVPVPRLTHKFQQTKLGAGYLFFAQSI